MSNAALTDTPFPDHVLDTATPRRSTHDADAWIRWAWAFLARAEELPAQIDEDHEDYPGYLITLAALGHVFELFQQVVVGGDADLDPDVELDGALRPEISTIEIARYCEQHAIYDTSLPESASGLVREAIRDRASRLQHRLLNILGGGRLFTSLYVTGGHALDAELGDEAAPTSLNPSEEAFDSYLHVVVNEDSTAEKLRAYAWLEGDLDLG